MNPTEIELALRDTLANPCGPQVVPLVSDIAQHCRKVIAASALLFAVAPAMGMASCPAYNVAKHPPHMVDDCQSCERRFERTLPLGTRIYAYDQFVVMNRRMPHFSRLSKLWCDARQFYVHDPVNNRTETFSLNTKVVYWRAATEVTVQPGKPLAASLRRDIKIGLAHYRTTVGRERSKYGDFT